MVKQGGAQTRFGHARMLVGQRGGPLTLLVESRARRQALGNAAQRKESVVTDRHVGFGREAVQGHV